MQGSGGRSQELAILILPTLQNFLALWDIRRVKKITFLEARLETINAHSKPGVY